MFPSLDLKHGVLEMFKLSVTGKRKVNDVEGACEISYNC